VSASGELFSSSVRKESRSISAIKNELHPAETKKILQQGGLGKRGIRSKREKKKEAASFLQQKQFSPVLGHWGGGEKSRMGIVRKGKGGAKHAIKKKRETPV